MEKSIETTQPETPSATPTPKSYPQFVNTDAVIAYLTELHKQVDQMAFILRSTIQFLVSGSAPTSAEAQSKEATQETPGASSKESV